MKNIRIIKIMSLVVCILLFTACKFSNNTPEPEDMDGPIKMPKALFLYHFEYVDIGEKISYIDEFGNIYTADLSSEERALKFPELNESLNSSKHQKIGHVNEEQLNKMYQMFLQVPLESGEKENLIFTQDEQEDEKGNHKWYGFRYDEQGKLKYVLLNGEGKLIYENQDETAQEIAGWLKENMVEYDIYGKWNNGEE